MHQHHKRLGAFVLENQRLDNGVFIDVEFAGRDLGAAVLLVVIEMRREGDLVGLEKSNGRRFRSVFVLHDSVLWLDMDTLEA